MNQFGENQAEVGGREKRLGLGEKLAEVCGGEVLQGAAEAVEFDRKGLRENTALITHERIGRSFRFERQHLDRFLAQHRRRSRQGVFA